MPRTQNEFDIVVPIAQSTMDANSPPANLPDGSFYRLYGVDGRFPNSLRSFPGFVKTEEAKLVCFPSWLGSSTTATTTSMPGPWYLGEGVKYTKCPEPFQTQYMDGSTLTTIQGISEIGLSNGTHKYGSFAFDGGHSFVFRTTKDPEYYYGSSAVGDYVGPNHWYTGNSSMTNFSITSSDEAATGGFLTYRGKYGYAFRWKDTTNGRNLRTGMTKQNLYYVISPTGETNKFTITANKPEYATTPINTNTYDTLEIYRTINLRTVGDVLTSGILYKEREIVLTETSTTPSPGVSQTFQVDIGLVSDEVLVQGEQYDPWNDPILEPEKTGAAVIFKGILFTGFEDTPGFCWNNPDAGNLESFTDTCRYDGDSFDGIITRFLPVSDYLFAFTERLAYQITVSGTSVSVTKCLENNVPLNRLSVTSASGLIFMLTGQGIVAVDSGSLSVQQLKAANSVVFGDWMSGTPGTNSNYTVAYDAKYSCVVFMKYFEANDDPNYTTAHAEAILLWTTTGSITMLKNLPFLSVTNLSYDGIQRAIFLHDYEVTGYTQAYVIGDEDITRPVLTGASKVAGTTPVPYGTTALAIDYTTNKVYPLGFVTASSVADGVITYTFSSPLGSPTLAAGMYLQLGGVWGEVVMPTLKTGLNSNFSRVTVKSAQAAVNILPDSDTTPPMGQITLFRHLEELTPNEMGNAGMRLTGNPASNVQMVNVDGCHVYPVFRFFGSGSEPVEVTSLMFTVVGNFSESTRNTE